MSVDPIEIIIEPDVVPRGTVDLKALDAPPGTPPPKVRVTRSGKVVPLGADSAGRIDRDADERHDADVLTPEVMSEVRAAVRDGLSGSLGAAAAAALVPEEAPAADQPEAEAPAPASEPEVVRAPDEPVPEFDPAPEPAEAAEGWEPPPGFQLEPPPVDATATPDYAALDAAASAPMPSRPKSARAEPVLAAAPSDAAFDPRFDTNIDGPGSIFDVIKVLAYLLILFGGIGILGMWMTGTLPRPAASEVAQKTDETTVTVSAPKLGTPSATPAPEASETPAPTPSPEATAEPTPAPTPEATAEPTPAPTPEATAAPTPAPTPEPTAKPTPAPSETPAPEPTAKPSPKDQLVALREMAKKAGTGVEVGVERDPIEQRVADLRERAKRALDAGDLAGAKQALRQLLKLDPDDPEGLLQLGYVHHQEGDLATAITHYRRSAQHAPSDPRPWNNLYLAHDARGELADAKRSLKKALQLGPENPDVLTNLANFVGRRSARRAHPLLDKALATDPEHGPARLARGAVRERLGDATGARDDYRRLLKRQDETYKAQAFDGLGRVARRSGKPQVAIRLHQRALQRDPELHSARVGLGLALLAADDLERATKVLEQATKKTPGSVAAWRALGVAYARQSETASYQLVKAKQAYEQAIRLAPQDWRSRYNYALLAERAGNFPVAIMQLEKALELEPKAWEPYVRLANLYADTQRGAKALGYIDRALKHNPNEPELHLYRARLLAGQDRRIEARSALRDFVRNAAPNDPRLEKIRKGLQ